MHKVEYATANEIFPLIKELLDQGNAVKLTITGNSMYPFLRDGLDSVELEAVHTLDIGDIVLIVREKGQYVLHRVIKVNRNSFYIMGDAQGWIEGPLKFEQTLAVVKKIWRRNNCIDCNSFKWKFISRLWIGSIPIRVILHKSIRGFEIISGLFRKRNSKC